jgi:dTDP-4-amino-4,6-dideoxygalactose transaminase
MKVFPGYGEVGAVLTGDRDVYERLQSLRYLGTVNKEVCIEPVLNFKMDTIQAAMMLVSFETLEPALDRRVAIARRYHGGLKDVVGCPPPPRTPADRRSVFFDYTITSPRRAELRRFLEQRGIEAKIRHPLLLPQHPAHRPYDTRPLPNGERLVKQILSLPIHEKLTDSQVDYVIGAVAEFHR